jgi:exopolysaccharide biosynthesis protein
VGFSATDVLFNWIGIDEVQGNRIHSKKPGWNDCHAALGAGPLLINRGKSLTETDLEGFNKTLIAPRTAIGKRKDGLVWLIVVDGRQPVWSYEGVTLEELTEIFIARGAEYAINLDGGGSSIMVLGTEIVSKPSDNAITRMIGTERPVANVIALFKK